MVKILWYQVPFLQPTSSLCWLQHYPSQGYYCWDNTPWAKSTGRGKGSFGLYSLITVHHLKSQDRNSSRTGTWRRAAYYLAPHGLLSLFIIEPRPSASDGPTHNGLGLLTSITNLENALHACLQPSLRRHFFFQSSLPPLRWLSLVSNWYRASQHKHYSL